jgi:glycosyltransferase involved in cell wall biosynthesis
VVTNAQQSEPLVTVVTPFYNTAEYLAECIESVLRQTYRNFEYVLVDNHSTDGGGEIARQYAARDPRIRFLRADQFRKQLPNYNYTIAQASPDSRYVKFAQADDWLYPSCLTEMVALAEANPRVGVVSSYELRGNEVHGNGLTPEQAVLSGRDAALQYFSKWRFLFGSPTTVMYRREVIDEHSPFFEVERYHADTDAIFRILGRHDFGFVHQVLCFIRTQDDSITGRSRTLADNALDRYIIVKRYAAQFLSPDEAAECVAATESWYYDDLGRQWISERMGKRNEEFWQYHARGLATIGEQVDWKRVYRASGAIVVDKLLNPGASLRKLRKQGLKPVAALRKSPE